MKLAPDVQVHGTTFDEVTSALALRHRRYYDCPLSELTIAEDSGELSTLGESFPMTEFAARSLGGKLGVLGRFVAKAPTEIAAQTLNYFAPRAQGSVRLAVENGIVKGVMASTANPIEASTLVDRFSEVSNFDLSKWVLDERGLVLRFSSPSLTAEPRVGDLVRAGVDVIDYENEGGHLGVVGSLFRLVCSNGQVCPEVNRTRQLRKEGWRSPDQLVALALANFTGVAEEVAAFAEQLPQLTQVPLELPDDVNDLDRVLRHGPLKLVRVPGRFANGVADALNGEEPTLYGFYNANTRLGRDAGDRALRRRFEQAGYLTVTRRVALADAFAEALSTD